MIVTIVKANKKTHIKISKPQCTILLPKFWTNILEQIAHVRNKKLVCQKLTDIFGDRCHYKKIVLSQLSYIWLSYILLENQLRKANVAQRSPLFIYIRLDLDLINSSNNKVSKMPYSQEQN